MMHKNAMSDALRAKKSQGLDLTIMIREPDEGSKKEEEMDRKEEGLAPDATRLGDAQDAKDIEMSKMVHDKNLKAGEGAFNHSEGHEGTPASYGDQLSVLGLGKNSIHGKMKKK